MTDTLERDRTAWLTDNWPWWLIVFFALVYEGYALITGQGRTLSRMVWSSAVLYPWMVPIVLSVVAWLVIHFFVTKGKQSLELPITGVIVVMIWMLYFAF